MTITSADNTAVLRYTVLIAPRSGPFHRLTYIHTAHAIVRASKLWCARLYLHTHTYTQRQRSAESQILVKEDYIYQPTHTRTMLKHSCKIHYRMKKSYGGYMHKIVFCVKCLVISLVLWLGKTTNPDSLTYQKPARL